MPRKSKIYQNTTYKLKKLSFQLVNKIPGMQALSNKRTLSTSGTSLMPRGFNLPKDTEKLREFIQQKPNATLIRKNNNHRGIM